MLNCFYITMKQYISVFGKMCKTGTEGMFLLQQCYRKLIPALSMMEDLICECLKVLTTYLCSKPLFRLQILCLVVMGKQERWGGGAHSSLFLMLLFNPEVILQ